MGRIKKTKNKAEVQNRIYQVSKDLINLENTEDIKRKYSELWDCSTTNVNWYIKKAYELIEESTQRNVDKLITRQTQTLQKIANEAMTQGDRVNAIKAVDIINKLSNLYVEKQEINVTTDAPITVSFGTLTVANTPDTDEPF